MGLFDFISTPSPDKAAMTPGDQNTQSKGILASMTPDQGQMLMALGQGLLSQNGFGPGLAAGFQGAGEVAQQQQKLAAQKEQNDILNQIKGYNAVTGRMGTEARVAKLQQDVANGNKPKFLTKIGDTIIMQGADGKPEPYTDQELQAAFGREYDKKLGLANAVFAGKESMREPSPSEIKEGVAVRQASDNAADAVKQYKDILNIVGENGQNSPDMIYKLDPTGIYAKVNRAVGTDQAKVDMNLAKIKRLEAFAADIGSQAGISNYEREILQAPIPTSGDDGKLIAESLKDKIKVLEQVAERKKAEADALPSKYRQGAGGVATTGDKPVNNPGNLRPPGQSTGFQQFPTPEAGAAAAENQLRIYGTRGINTISKIVSTWSPPNENDTPTLIANAAKRLGVDPNTPLDMNNPAVIKSIASAIFMQEGNGKSVTPMPGQNSAKADNDPLGIRKR